MGELATLTVLAALRAELDAAQIAAEDARVALRRQRFPSSADRAEVSARTGIVLGLRLAMDEVRRLADADEPEVTQ